MRTDQMQQMQTHILGRRCQIFPGLTVVRRNFRQSEFTSSSPIEIWPTILPVVVIHDKPLSDNDFPKLSGIVKQNSAMRRSTFNAD